MDAGQRFGDLLRLLARHGVEHVVVDAAAAVLHGAPMTTFDLEAVIESKEAAGRPKDLAALPLLRETLRLSRQREDR